MQSRTESLLLAWDRNSSNIQPIVDKVIPINTPRPKLDEVTLQDMFKRLIYLLELISNRKSNSRAITGVRWLCNMKDSDVEFFSTPHDNLLGNFIATSVYRFGLRQFVFLVDTKRMHAGFTNDPFSNYELTITKCSRGLPQQSILLQLTLACW